LTTTKIDVCLRKHLIVSLAYQLMKNHYFYRFYHDLASVSHLFEMTISWAGEIKIKNKLTNYLQKLEAIA
ncbi:hypothetical protein QUA56_02335, partial [Microcoleus sp. N3A4]|uniref:hypothetical protein n=1 Tax=Microcoleus sp. N3A4 TaxID=3055379 RepID=UPI002FD4658F